MRLDKRVIDFSQLVPIRQWQVEMGRQPDIVGSNLCKWLDICYFFDVLDLRDLNLVFLDWSFGFGFFLSDADDESFFIGVHFVELFFGCDELEGFRPVEFGAVAHCD